jgi:hypothetical protein
MIAQGDILYLASLPTDNELLMARLQKGNVDVGSKGRMIYIHYTNMGAYFCFKLTAINRGKCKKDVDGTWCKNCLGVDGTLIEPYLSREFISTKAKVDDIILFDNLDIRRIKLKGGKKMTKEELKRLIIEATETGTKAVDLAVRLPKAAFVTFESQEIMATIQELITAGEIIEIEYKLPNGAVKSFLLPKGVELL